MNRRVPQNAGRFSSGFTTSGLSSSARLHWVGEVSIGRSNYNTLLVPFRVCRRKQENRKPDRSRHMDPLTATLHRSLTVWRQACWYDSGIKHILPTRRISASELQLLIWPPLWSSGQSSWLHNEDVLCFLWGTNWIYICYVEERRPPLWSSGQSSWLYNGDVLCFL
jgi:hypothetical protein